MNSTFREFVSSKTRRAKKHLEIVKKILKKEGLTVSDFLEEDDPYIYVKNPGGGLSFDGARIYNVGTDLAYRIQKEDKTHPYGKAYLLDVEGMFNDLISDNMSEQKAGEEIIKAVAKEFKEFFNKSSKAEKDLRASEFELSGDPMNSIAANPHGTDYSNTIHGSSK